MTAADDDSVARALAEVARLGDEAAELAAQAAGTGASLVPTGPAVPAEQVKSGMVEIRRQIAEKTRQLEAARLAAQRAIEAQQRALADQLTQMSASLAPLKQQMALMQEGIWSINLYLGVGEEIVALAQGTPAPAGTPICIRQGVLAMDEECAVAAEAGGIDFLQIDAFDEWITADPAHLEQLIPEPRGVVAIMPRRSAKDYGGGLGDVVGNELNHQTYLLVRNGECLYRYIADGFNAGQRLTPLRDEFTSMFTTRHYNPATGEVETVQLQPGTPAWDRAERAAGARQRHYMRVALILQGLVDRTAALSPLPVPGLSLLHPQAYEDGHVVLISDEETALSSTRKPFHAWLSECNAQLRPGMRIAGHFACEAWRDSNDCRDPGSLRASYGRHSRLWPQTASHPETGQIYTIDHRDGSYLVFLYDRTDEVWRRNVPVPGQPGYVYTGLHPTAPRQRASARVSPTDSFVIPLDLVTISECEAYLRARTERHAYREMFPLLKAVIAAKRAEAAAEEPMRQLLAGHIAREHGVSIADAAAAVPDLVHWWKLANRWHRPLVTGREDPQAEARAVTAITREFAARRAAISQADQEDELAARLRVLVRAVMLLARKRDGTWVALERQPRAIDGEPDNVWVRQHTWSKTLTGHRIREWVLPEPAQVARWRILWSAPAWNAHDLTAAAAGQLTDPEIRDIIAAGTGAAARQASTPYQPYRSGDAQPPLGGQAAAVTAPAPGGEDGRRFTLYWLCAPADGGRGVAGAEMTIRWKRTTGGKIQISPGMLRQATWTGIPWEHRGRLIWHDQHAAAALTAALETYRAAAEASRQLLLQAAGLCAAIAAQWSDDARESARRKFIAAYGDESLWPGHAASLRFDCPHRGSTGWPKPWEKAVERLVNDGATLAGVTVTDMAAQYADRYGEPAEVPAEIAHYRFPAPDDDGPGGP